ncbi:MAG: S8 family serine peptidase [Actinobacteria bacterium]|nr:S8 family serine peptidase [Actinomycetota bacterium]
MKFAWGPSAVRPTTIAVRLVLTTAVLLTGLLAPAVATAAPGYDPDRVLVAFAPGASGAERAQAHRAQRGRVENVLPWMKLDVVRLPKGADPQQAAVRYERNPNVAYAHPNWKVSLLSAPDDTLFRDLWGLHNTGQVSTGWLAAGKPDADIDAPEGWDAAFGVDSFPTSGGTRIGILDTGIDLAHADLRGKTEACASALTGMGVIVEGVCSDDGLHGTHVAGTAAAVTNNSLGVAGVAPNAELAVFKALNAAGVGFYADLLAGVHWLYTTGGAKVINMSIGGPQDDALDQELSEAYAVGALLIAAAGNDGDSTKNYPAYHPDVVSVAATDPEDEPAWFSNCNSDVEVAAPGVNIWSTTPGNAYAPLDGTSMATPHVSGVAAMIMSEQGLDAPSTRKQLVGTTDDLGPAGRDTCFGYGRINLVRALGSTTTEPAPTDPGAIAGKVTDQRSKAAIGGATVDCGSGGMATAAGDGTYSIASVPVGSYTCTASATGYRSKRQSVTVSSNTTTTANFALRQKR